MNKAFKIEVIAHVVLGEARANKNCYDYMLVRKLSSHDIWKETGVTLSHIEMLENSLG